MRSVALCLLLALAGCGGSGAPFDPVTRVTFVVGLPEVGRSHWDESGSSIVIDAECEAPACVLRHELWHLLTRREDHTAEEGCWSAERAYCGYGNAEDVMTVLAAGSPVVTISFPEDPLAAQMAAEDWNIALQYEAVIVVD